MKTLVLIPAVLTLTLATACTRSDAQVTPETVDGKTVLADMAAAYLTAPALVDDMQVSIRTAGKTRSTTARVVLGDGADALIEVDGFVITSVGGRLVIERPDAHEKYVEAPLSGDIINSFKNATGTVLPAPQCVLRYAATTEEYLDALSLGRAANLVLKEVRRIEQDGRQYFELRLKGDGGATARALVDEGTNLLARVEVDTGVTKIVMDMSPQLLDRLPEPLDVQVAGRRKVSSIQQLMNLAAGDLAPDFTLEDLDGRRVTLSELRGSMVVLDFWATWCGPCRIGLPKLQEFDTWARAEGLPVQVLPVNIAERVRTADARKQRVGSFWRGKGYTMPTLMNYDDSVAATYNVGPIPHTVVIGPDGRIVQVQVGYNANAVNHLRKLAGELVGGS